MVYSLLELQLHYDGKVHAMVDGQRSMVYTSLAMALNDFWEPYTVLATTQCVTHYLKRISK